VKLQLTCVVVALLTVGVTGQPPATVTYTQAQAARGEQLYQQRCAACHGEDVNGDGNGIIVQRGMPSPTSYHADRLRLADDQHFFDVITNGYGVMYSYASRIPPRDRWAIVAYIRALQLSRHASIDDVPSTERDKLLSTP